MLTRNFTAIFTAIAIAITLLPALPAVATEPLEAPEEVEPPGETAAARPAPLAQAVPFDNLAVVLVIDVSGSMSYTDPERLRETAAGMLIDLLGADDYLGVVIFDDRAEVVAPLAPAGGAAEREALFEKLKTRLDPRGDTDFIAALNLAYRQFAEKDIGGKVPVILLLTDGEPDPYPRSREDESFMAGYMEELWTTVDYLAGEEILVYTVGFSDEVDPEVIRGISTTSRGQYYILQEPAELLLAFYQALEALKDRRSFLSEEIDLGEGSSHSFSFKLDQFTRQLNLVLVSDAAAGGDDLEVTVKPPRGRAEDVDELTIGGRDNYLALIVSQPKEELYGTWEVEVSGSGRVLALGNADLYLEALLVDPDPGASYPLHEPMEVVVEVITRERYAGEHFRIEMQVTAPGDPSPIGILMQGDGNLFRGTYEYADSPGEYLFEWSVLLDGEAVLDNSALIPVRNLPAITTDLWVSGEGMRLGEQVLVSASLSRGGERLQEGPHLQVDSFDLKMEYRDGARIEYALHDSGDREHGNSRAGDGIWSNYLLFDREGSARVVMSARGTYREEKFVLQKSFGLTVAEAGTLVVRLEPLELWSQAGQVFAVPLTVESSSPFTQTLRLQPGSEQVAIISDRLVIPPGESLVEAIEFKVEEEAEAGLQPVSLSFRVEDGMTSVEPQELFFEVQVLTGREAFMRRFSGLGAGIVFGFGALLLFGGLFFGGGTLLDRYYLKPRLKVSGSLAYREEGEAAAATESGEEGRLDLGQPGKRVVTVTIGQENLNSDFMVPAGCGSYRMVISTRWNDHLPRFARGWKALFGRSLTVETLLKCTPPGVVVNDGKISSGIELHDGDRFGSGGYLFQYSREEEKGLKAGGRGKDLLDGKM